MIGQTINHYKITEKLGAGGMGEVFLASDTKLDRQVALKFLPERLTRDPEAHERLLREAQAASRLNHPNILTIYSVEEDGNRVFIVMEYVDGLQLDDYMRERKPRLDEILGVAIGIAGGLAKAHQAGITHRDLKPGNILIDTDERVKILDFGLAKLEGASKLTRTGSTLGTVSYMSPEQGRGDHTDSRSDLFSFGVVLYEMITGQPAFGGEHEAAILYASANDEPEPLARFKADVPDELQRIVTKCLAKRPADRYQSAADLLTDLKTMQRSLSPLSTVTTTGGYSPQRKRTGLVISASALAMIVLAVLIFKPWKIVVEPTQEAAAVQNLLAVMYFDNLSDPDDAGRLGEIAANLLITDLSESQYVQVVSSQRLFDLLNLLGHTGDKRIDRATATEVARKAQARWMLMGSLLKTEPNIVLTAQLVEVETGNAVASQRINGESGEDIFALVDRLTIEVKSDLSLPYESTSESDLVIADGTTHSTEAYRYYLSGVENAQRFYWQEAKQDFLNAVERDSTFAMAYLYLSWYEQGTRAEIEEWTATALRHSKDIPQKDRWYIEAQSRYMMHDVEASNALLERLVAKYPDEKMAYMGLAYAHRDNGKYEEAIAALQRVVAIDPAYGLAYNLMAYTYDEMDDFDNSITAINKYIELAPNEANPYDTRGDLYAYNGKLKQAVASFRDALARKPDFYPSLRKIGQVALLQRNYSLADSCFAAMSASDDEKTRSEGRTSLALIPAYQGRFADALLLLDDALAADRLEQYEGSPHAIKLRVKTVLLQELGRYTETITLWRTNTDAMYRINPTDVVGFMPWIAALHARSGEFEEADSILTVLHENILARDSSQIYGYWYGKAAVALARGDAAAAIEATRNNTGWQLEYWVHQQRAQAYLALGQPAEAIPPIEKYLGRFDKAGVYDPGLMIGAHYLLGQAYEQSGWTDKAIEKYELFLEIWKDADPEILMVQDAEERLARLTNES